MKYLVIEAEYIENYKVELTFKDSTKVIFNFDGEFDGPIFEPLKDPKYFRSFSLTGGTISWKNGADFSPEYLYFKSKKKEKTVA